MDKRLKSVFMYWFLKKNVKKYCDNDQNTSHVLFLEKRPSYIEQGTYTFSKKRSKYSNKIYKNCIHKEEKRPQKEIAVHTPFPHIRMYQMYICSFKFLMLRALGNNISKIFILYIELAYKYFFLRGRPQHRMRGAYTPPFSFVF